MISLEFVVFSDIDNFRLKRRFIINKILFKNRLYRFPLNVLYNMKKGDGRISELDALA